MTAGGLLALQSTLAGARASGETISLDAEALVTRLYRAEGASLVRLARLFVDDRNAAEDIVQEAFLRLARAAGRIRSDDAAPAYLRSIVLNLARDHNRRGLVSLRHRSTGELIADEQPAVVAPDPLVTGEQHAAVLRAVASLPARQRDCITLRYFDELGIEAIATTLGVSANSVKTHLQRGLSRLEQQLAAT